MRVEIHHALSDARASADLIEPGGRSKVLSCRILFRKTGSHFCGECSSGGPHDQIRTRSEDCRNQSPPLPARC
ncbi:hypothetical protein F1193_08275 [Blastochloris sulfoviridis]|uniref:Uncharacterized protein n=1 Tax=Blastochloris sulfoviridis TaxID=50712 RepID=A0A5M6I152_9HYPH|nr:hypothetical protein F1193_08275 [Blastochloris sulfoviridis]